MKSTRKLSLLMIAVFVLSLVFQVNVATLADSAPVEIRAAWWGGTERNEVYQAIIDRFMEAYPHVTVISEPAAWGDYWDKLTVQAAGGNAPDMMGMNRSFAVDYLGRGACAPLDAYVADGTIDLSQWEASTVETGVYNGVNYMIPMGVTFRSAYLNIGVLKELGVTVPSFDWTWDDVRTIGLEVKAAQEARGVDNAWFFQSIGGDWGIFNFYARQHGKDFYTEDGKLGVDAELIAKWWTMWKEFVDEGICPDIETGVEYESATLEEGLLSQDRVLIDLNAANQFPAYCATFPDKEMVLIRFPSLAGGTNMEYAEGSHFAISAKSSDEKKLAAAQLINFWVNDARGLELFLIDQGVPGNLALLDTAVMPNLNDAQNAFVEFVAKVSPLAGNPPPISPLGYSECLAEFGLQTDNVMYGVMTPEEAAVEFVALANDILAKQ